MHQTQKKWLQLAAPLVAAVVLAGCSGAGQGGGANGAAVDQAAINRGRQIYMASCAACHGPDARGLPELGIGLVEPSPWLQQQSDADLLAFLKEGRRARDPLNTTGIDMPPRGGNPALSDADLENVIRYLRSIQKK